MYSSRTKHRIWYDTAGQGAPMLLIMGFTMRGTAWKRNIPELSKHHELAWFDHAGLGESSPLRKKRLMMHDMVDDAMGVMDDMGWDRAHIVGISMGGMIAQHLALNHPERVDTLTLTATHAGGWGAMVPPLRGVRLFMEANQGPRGRRLDALAELLFSPTFLQQEPKLAQQMLHDDFQHEPPVETRMAQLHAISRHFTAHRLHELSDTSTLVIRPGRDLLIAPRESDRLHQLIPGSKLVRFDDCGHGVTRQLSESFNEAVLAHTNAKRERRGR